MVAAYSASTSAIASPWIFTTTGKISQGYDYAGVFGAVGSITGKSYSMSTIIDPKAYEIQDASRPGQYSGSGHQSRKVAQQVTVDGFVRAYEFVLDDDEWGNVQLTSIPNFLSGAYLNEGGNVNAQQKLFISHFVYSKTNNFVKSLSYGAQSFSYDVQVGDNQLATFYLTSFDYMRPQVNVYADISRISITQADVPEPAPLVLMFAGMLAFAVRRRPG